MRHLPLLILVIFTTQISCFDKIKTSPPCFYEGTESPTMSSEVSINACCEQGAEGNTFCRDLFRNEGYMTISNLAQCAPAGYCLLCEIGVNCGCLSNRDCESNQQCSLSDDATVCTEQLGDGFSGQRCSICEDL